MTDWTIRAFELANCNCAFGCPCQFSQLPSDGTCEAAVAFDIKEGHYGNVDLGGLKAATLYKWPGAVHEGNGQMQLIIDEAATAEQRAALEAIMTGEDTEEMATMWYVFGAMSPNRHPVLTAKIDMAYDRETGIGSIKVGDVFRTEIKPIPNIVSGDPHRVAVTLPHGFEFAEAEFACGSTETRDAAIELLKNNASHAHVAHLHLTGAGVVRA
ncbi:DUF1326 domain-containing protein [Salipiger mucosus]|uniref:DUF1326 domain-containing protein n=1 Tax=Salipiger mucosus DSM 16094 TaxID=1123237 RepID=S9S0G3_9RHOB|nr:DUF1326 domain-containing protein [Salipiger mucosus]EPX79724.1 hypothetical protein Salmuc_05667 [Salipiger mucosus DSM 16094]